MKVDEFLKLMQKVLNFKLRLEKEGVIGHQQQIILKVYINDLTDRINTTMLRRVI